jgi:hypothetical protein
MTEIVTRYEKGMKFLDLIRYHMRSMDENGFYVTDECWECCIYENGADANEHDAVEFGNEFMARMFIDQNGWKEQVQ